MRVTTESPLVTRTVVGGREYTARDGIFHMPEPAARAYLKATEQAALSLAGVRRAGDGFWCPACRFASYFTTCSKCGGACRRETETPDGCTNEDRRRGPVGW